MEEKQKNNKSEIISVRLDTLTKEKLTFICELEYRPMALQIRKIIEDYIKNYENKCNLLNNPYYPGYLDLPL
ncbi:hypothetical protein RC29_02630 [Campylobacter jejuni]|uniref:hypothetical protein n=1 Tax=Campylobacter jejuni TaxID=197 RepID=UPI00050220E4|nr:hypothetical protein [Campylobacter jejuni]ALV96485.1 hypothetical protein RC36_02490 [Campylobacter jejuni]ALW01237.1 hypothetical protein RC37_02485 [Campylobacter jejuni]ALW17611.1 hypothetical protein RB99_04725 [Campylobacter jejuni]ALW26734.1 hypothetical protein RC29_02630 [Campylobacter jejuni]ALW56876.1 hypothetical protein QY02_02530 [Campylobacter jejuni]